MFLVMWAHIISTGMNAYEIPGVINGVMSVPIINGGYRLGILEYLCINKLHTQTGILGVAMFFICTGYLVPSMLERYRRREFLINRFFRIYPVLATTVLLWGIVVFLSQGVAFNWKQYLSIITLSHQLFAVPSFMGILWTLVIEVFFYVIAAMWRKIDEAVIAAMYIIIILTGLLYHEFPNRFTGDLFYDLRYMGFILLGSAVYCAQHNKNSSVVQKLVTVGLPFLCNLLIFQGARYVFGDETTYPNFFSHLIPLLIMLGLLYLETRCPALFNHIPSFFTRIAELAYCVYLSHVCIGLTCMFWLSKIGMNPYLVALSGFVSSFLVAKVMYLLIERPFARWSRSIIHTMKRDRIKETT